MTPPDSGDTGWFCGCGTPISASAMGCARWPKCAQPDSGEREVPLSLQQVHLPIRLAQRILAALETGMAGTIGEAQKQISLADELRAIVERKT